MPPSHVAEHYQVYKQGGEEIARWLVATAAECGTSQATNSSNRSVPAAQLLQLSKAIAAKFPPIRVPDEILEIIEEVIDARENCANFYAGQGIRCSGHHYYLGIIRQVHEILKRAQVERIPRIRAQMRAIQHGPEPETSPAHAEEEDEVHSVECHHIEDTPPDEWIVAHRKRRRRSARSVEVAC